jgi:Mg2+ and Co2+ transporter CorA
MLPQLFSKPSYSLLDCFKSMFEHEWHFHLLFDSIPGVLPPHILLYMLASSLWETNFRYLDTEIKRLSFNDIRHPNLEINSILHDRREDLEQLKNSIIDTKKYTFGNISEYFKELPHHQNKIYTNNRTAIENLEMILDEATKLDKFLMDTFQLLMSSISVEQAQRGTLLTQLAFIYVPLSFVASIFGMNAKEINGSLPSIWICIVVMAIVLICTIVIFSSIKACTRQKQRKCRESQQEAIYSTA